MKKTVLFEPFQKQEYFLDCVFNTDFTVIIYGGGIRSGKTFAGLGALILLSVVYPGSRWAVVRKDNPTLTRNTLPSWEKIKPDKSIRSFNYKTMTAEFWNGSKIIFFPENYDKDKELNRWKGLEVNGFLLEEMNELQEVSFNKAIERAGSYIIPGNNPQPRPLVLGTVNPSFGWVKSKIYDSWKNNTLPKNFTFIEAKIFDNPYISEQYKENLRSLPKYQYRVFVLGDWDARLKTGGEFFKSFEPDKHIHPTSFNPDYPIHVSIDSNVLPYVSVQIHQIIEDDGVYYPTLIDELPLTDPNNSAKAAGKQLALWLNEYLYELPVYLYGDPTTKNRNTIDPSKRSFYDLFVGELKRFGFEVKDRFFKKAPVVIATGQFINDVFEEQYPHIRIVIGEQCPTSINDFIDSKEDINGGILKVRTKNKDGQTYEKNGHFSDCFRYFICKAFEKEFKEYKKSIKFKFSHGQFRNYIK